MEITNFDGRFQRLITNLRIGYGNYREYDFPERKWHEKEEAAI